MTSSTASKTSPRITKIPTFAWDVQEFINYLFFSVVADGRSTDYTIVVIYTQWPVVSSQWPVKTTRHGLHHCSHLHCALSEIASFVGSSEWIASAIEIPAVSNSAYCQTLENT